MIGQTVSHYKITKKLGEGGMGEVYRAVDTKLNRDVALKILPQAFAQDSERMVRFEREAQVLASLNHPHIAQIHGLEDSEGVHALVLELVEGETLGERLEKGPIPIDEAFRVALQIAEGLEAAHERGIIHRDLKPANIKITPEGQAKILDFGLAKAMEGDAPVCDLSHSPTLTEATRAGIILGTAAYMSPEQARGQVVDKRADIWSFGVVLYEMLVGKPPFGGDTASDLLAAVLRSEPDFDLLPTSVSSRLRVILAHCLRRDARQRLRDIGDARIFLDEIEKPEADAAALRIPVKSWERRAVGVLPWALLSILLISLTLGWLPFSSGVDQEDTIVRFSIKTSGWTLPVTFLDTPIVDISRDGKQVAFISGVEGVPHLFLRRIDEFESIQMEGTQGATNPFFSPDGQWIGFIAEGQLKKVSSRGKTVIELCKVPGRNRGAWWGDNGRIVYSPSYQSPLFEISESGGTPVPLTELEAHSEERTHRFPQVLPDGDSVLFTIGFIDSPSQYDDAHIAVYSRSTGETRILIRGGHMARYVSSGHLVYKRSGVLFAVPFDLANLEVTGEAVPVSETVGGEPSSGAAYFAISDRGMFVYRPGHNVVNDQKLVLVDRNGTITPLPLDRNAFNTPRFSPDGRRLAYGIGSAGSGTGDIWILDLETNLSTRLTFSEVNASPVWSRDGRFVYFGSARGRAQGIYRKACDGTGAEEPVHLRGEMFSPTGIRPEGKTILSTVYAPAVQIIQLRLQEGGTADREKFGSDGGYQWGATYSPNFRWVAYTSDGTGRNEVYVEPAAGAGRWQISTDGGMNPVWGPDGRELFFADFRGIYRVEVSSEGNFGHGKPSLLVTGDFVLQTPDFTNFDISPDGKSFALIQPGESDAAPQELYLTLNWFEELRRLCPTDE